MSVSVDRRKDVELAVDGVRAVLDRADGEDRDLRRVEHGDELLDPVHAEVRDRERAVLEIGELELSVAGAGDEIGADGGDLEHRPAVRVSDDRDDQPVRRRDRDADVRNGEAHDLPVDELRVDRAVAHERGRDDLRQQVVHGRLRVALAQELDHPLSRRDELGGVGGDGELEDRRRPGLGEAAGDGLADGRELDDLDLARSRGERRRRSCRGRGGRCGGGLLDVLGDDPPVRPGPGQRGEVDAALARDPPRERRRLHALTRLASGRFRPL